MGSNYDIHVKTCTNTFLFLSFSSFFFLFFIFPSPLIPSLQYSSLPLFDHSHFLFGPFLLLPSIHLSFCHPFPSFYFFFFHPLSSLGSFLCFHFFPSFPMPCPSSLSFSIIFSFLSFSSPWVFYLVLLPFHSFPSPPLSLFSAFPFFYPFLSPSLPLPICTFHSILLIYFIYCSSCIAVIADADAAFQQVLHKVCPGHLVLSLQDFCIEVGTAFKNSPRTNLVIFVCVQFLPDDDELSSLFSLAVDPSDTRQGTRRKMGTGR